MGKLFRSWLNVQIFQEIEKQWRFSSKGPSVKKLRLAQQRRRITLWAPTIEVYMLYESLLDTKPNKENGPWPLPGTLVKPDWRSEKSHFSWNCDGACVDHCFSIFSLFRQPLELVFSEIKEKWCANVILDWFWLNLVARTSILND